MVSDGAHTYQVMEHMEHMEPIDVPGRYATSCAILRHPQILAGLSFQSNVASAQLLLASVSSSHSASKQDYVELLSTLMRS